MICYIPIAYKFLFIGDRPFSYWHLQNLIVPSVLLLASIFPSGLNANEVISWGDLPSSPENISISLPKVTSQSLVFPSFGEVQMRVANCYLGE
jgi:hypothetical protein